MQILCAWLIFTGGIVAGAMFGWAGHEVNQVIDSSHLSFNERPGLVYYAMGFATFIFSWALGAILLTIHTSLPDSTPKL